MCIRRCRAPSPSGHRPRTPSAIRSANCLNPSRPMAYISTSERASLSHQPVLVRRGQMLDRRRPRPASLFGAWGHVRAGCVQYQGCDRGMAGSRPRERLSYPRAALSPRDLRGAINDVAMSRSRRKTPITGHTTAHSDAEWKAKAARVLRHRVKQKFETNPEDMNFSGKRWDTINPWSAPKDGKYWFGKRNSRLLRK